MSKYSPAQYQKHKDRYNKSSIAYHKRKIKRVPFDVSHAFYEKLKAYCDSHGEPVNTYLKRLCKEDAAKHGFDIS